MKPRPTVVALVRPRARAARRPTELAMIDGILARLARSVRLLGAVTPVNAVRERARLVAAIEEGKDARPGWTYADPRPMTPRRELETMAGALSHGRSSALDTIYLERVRELALECELMEAVGMRRFARLAARRFAPACREAAAEAGHLAQGWLAAAPAEAGGADETIRSDAIDPRSLLSRMREEARRQGLRVSVLPSDSLSALAAVGTDTIWIAAGRQVSASDVDRTVLHEIQGHALPRAKAARLEPGIFALGTAGGSDDQEGLALLLEERAGFLLGRRKRELAARHTVALCMSEGQSFAEAARELTRQGFDAPTTVRILERVYRGGDGEAPGLGRERVYLEAFVRVRAHLATRPEDEEVLLAGQIAVSRAGALRGLLPAR